MKKIDLQIHTTASDGSLSPKEVIDLAIKKGMKAIAITDHDTLSGIPEALEYAKEKNIEVIPGVEISCHEKDYKVAIDVLGLFIDYRNKELNRFLEKIREEVVNVPRKKASIKEAVDSIKTAGGIPILAHPGRYSNESMKIMEKFIEDGGMGIEAYYPYDKILGLKKDVNPIFKRITQEKNLLISGGSDFHDFERGSEIGDAGIDEKEFDILKRSISHNL